MTANSIAHLSAPVWTSNQLGFHTSSAPITAAGLRTGIRIDVDSSAILFAATVKGDLLAAQPAGKLRCPAGGFQRSGQHLIGLFQREFAVGKFPATLDLRRYDP